jgi:hypothetical protein
VLLLVILLPAVAMLLSRRPSVTSGSVTLDSNPDKFYLSATGKVFSYCFTYDPHAADAWMFRTAEGHLKSSNNGAGIELEPTASAH